MDDFQDRYISFLKSLEENEIDGFLTSQPTNLRYLFNLDAELGFAVTSDNETILLVDSRYIEIAEMETVNCKVKLAPSSLLQSLEELISKLFLTNRARIGFESDHLTHSLVSKLKSTILCKQMVPTANVIEHLRQVKSANELKAIRQAFEVSARAYHRIFEDFPWRGSELELAANLEYKLRLEGAEGIAFKTIVASGARSSNPHARPSESLIENSSLLLIDFGAIKNGYHSDTTRVLLSSQDEAEDILKIAQEAQNRAISGIQAGQKASTIDSLARKYIEDRGYGQYFGHSLGHGLGLEIHELPNVNSTSETVLEAGMVFTVEPGIYLPGRYGVRWEDAIIVTDSGCEVIRIDAPR